MERKILVPAPVKLSGILLLFFIKPRERKIQETAWVKPAKDGNGFVFSFINEVYEQGRVIGVSSVIYEPC